MNANVDSVPFQPGSELIEERAKHEELVEQCLAYLREGALPESVERTHIDIKEEAGRRGAGGRLLPGVVHNTQAADQMADEVAAMANTPGGGVLVLGIEDKTGDLLGTELDQEWLRNQIYRRIDVAPDIVERLERGIRLLIVFVAEAREPVEDTKDRLRWRVGSASVPVDRSEWWLRRQGRAGWDSFARESSRGPSDIRPTTIAIARDYLRRRSASDEGLADIAEASAEDMLRRLGVLTLSGRLTEAGALMFCSSPRPWLSWSRLDVEGGEVLAFDEDASGTSLIEQIAKVEAYIDAANDRVTLDGEFAEQAVRLIPPRAAREAVINGVVHRDWHQHAATTVTWVEEDASLTVVSPGGFSGGVTEHNLLVQRFSRSPALADLALALGLIDKQGIGVDRMFREMVVLGHRPPRISEIAGPRVRARLVGGRPVVPIMRLMKKLTPVARQRDVQVALIVHTLLHEPFVTADRLAEVLQRTAGEATEALEIAARCIVDEHPLLEAHKDVWLLSTPARLAVLGSGADQQMLARAGVLRYVAPSTEASRQIIDSWMSVHDRITSGDYAVITGMTQAGARRALERRLGDLLERGDETGRNAHFVSA